MTDQLEQTERTRLRRRHHRGHFDRATIYEILDSTPLCHFGYNLDGAPQVTPTLHWREGDHIYWHGSSASRALKAAIGSPVCLTVTQMDGLILARSAFHHSVNFRSVMIYGTPVATTDPDEKMQKFKNLIEHLYPSRWDSLRPVLDKEVKATAILSMPIDEASAKIKNDMPVDDEEDYDLPIWAGVVPVTTGLGAPIPDPRNLDSIEQPEGLDQILGWKHG